jgi:uncharacterized membrane protein
MRKLVLILMGLIAVSTFISAYNYPPAPGDASKASMEQTRNR